MTMTDLRPPHILVPFIEKALADIKAVAERVAMPYHKAAGEKLLEARKHFQFGDPEFREFYAWVRRAINIKKEQADTHMRLAQAAKGE